MDTYSRVSERNKNFQKESLLSHNELKLKSSIELRKRSRLNSINTKRLSQDVVLIDCADIPFEYLRPPNSDSSFYTLSDIFLQIGPLLVCSSEPTLLESLLKYIIKLFTNRSLIPRMLTITPLIDSLFLLFDHPSEEIKFLVSWCIINITAISTSGIIIDKHIYRLINLMKNGLYAKFTQQIVWILGNLASDNLETRDLIIVNKGADYIIDAIRGNEIANSEMPTCIWCLSNLLRGTPFPELKLIFNYISLIPRFIDLSEEAVFEMLWGISYITHSEELIDKVLEIVTIEHLLQKFWRNSKLQNPLLRILGNITAGYNWHTDLVVESGGIELFLENIDHDDRTKVRESLWALGNIAGSNSSNAKYLVSHKKFNKIVNFTTSFDCEIKHEALILCYNTLINCSFVEVLSVINSNSKIIDELLNLFENLVPEIVVLALNILDRIFTAEQEENLIFEASEKPILEIFIQLDGVAKLEKLQNHISNTVYSLAVKIIKKYWEYDEIANDSN